MDHVGGAIVKNKPLYIYGAGGFGREVAWVVEAINSQAEQWHIAGYIDDDPAMSGMLIGGYPVLPSMEAARIAAAEASSLYISLGVGFPHTRALLAQRAAASGFIPATLVHPAAVIGPSVTLGPGTIVAAGAVVGPNATLGGDVLLNVGGGVGHDATVGACTVVCPGARISGGCTVGAGVLVGSNAVIAPGRAVGDEAVVGALSFVVLDVRPGRTVLGNPAMAMRGKATAS